MAGCLEGVLRDDAASAPVLDERGRQRLSRAAESLSFRRARPVIGKGERVVTQDFDICDNVPQDTLFWSVAVDIQARINAARERMDPVPCPPVVFNDLVVQRYQPVRCGISPHRDHLRYVSLVGLLVIAGAGRFYICDDRSGRNAREIPAPEGSLLLMRAPRFAGRDDRPFHTLGDVTRERLILGLRQDAQLDPPAW